MDSLAWTGSLSEVLEAFRTDAAKGLSVQEAALRKQRDGLFEAFIRMGQSFKNDEAVKEFRAIMEELFGKRHGRGTKMLEPTYRQRGIGEADIWRTIEVAFGALL